MTIAAGLPHLFPEGKVLMHPGLLSAQPLPDHFNESRLSPSFPSSAWERGCLARGIALGRAENILCGMLSTLVLALILAPLSLAGENWPGWRGPTGMGQTDEKDLPLTWGSKTQDNLLWKSPLYPSDKVRKDHNQSSPIVYAGKVYATLSYWPEKVNEKEYPEHHLLCFQASDGKQLWDTKVEPGPWKLTDLRGGYSVSTPTCDGKRIYVVFGSAVIAAIDLEGKQVWRKEIKPFLFDVAIGASPVLYQDTVLFLCDQTDKKQSRLLAFDAASGNLKWDKPRPNSGWSHTTPALAMVGEKMQLLVGSANGPQGLDPANGDILWSFDSPKQIGDTVTPVFADGLVYVDSGRGGPGVAVEIPAAGMAAKQKWKLDNVPEGFSSPVVVGEYLYRLQNPGTVCCRKWATGAEVYKDALDGLDPACSPIATPDGRIYCGNAGKAFVLKAGPKFEVLARNDLGDPSQASPAVAAGKLYYKGGRYLYCIGKR